MRVDLTVGELKRQNFASPESNSNLPIYGRSLAVTEREEAIIVIEVHETKR